MKFIVQDYVHGVNEKCLGGEIFQITHTKNRLETGFCGWCGTKAIPTSYYIVFENNIPTFFINEMEVSEKQFKEVRTENEKVIKFFKELYMKHLRNKDKTKKLNKTIRNMRKKEESNSTKIVK